MTGGINTSYTLAGTQLISQTRNGSTSYYLQDGQGSTRALTNSAGAVTDTYSYTAYGDIYNQTGTTANNYLYTGQQFDQSSELYSLRARFYNPSWGRFLSQDTWTVNYNNPIELNRYGYAAGNPVNLSDPSGNFAEYISLNLNSSKNAKVVGTGVGTFAFITTAKVAVVMMLVAVPSITLVGLLFGVDIFMEELTKTKPDVKVKSLEQIMAETQWAVVKRLNPNPNPESEPEPEPQPTDYPPPPILPTPPSEEPRKIHLAFGTNDYLGSFLGNLFLEYRQQNTDVLLFDQWEAYSLTTHDVDSEFDKAYFDATGNVRVNKIHFNLEGIKRKGTSSYLEYIRKFSDGGVWHSKWERPDNFLVTAWELYWISNNPLLCAKTDFYEHGSTSLVTSPAAKAEICNH
jgi:RHS repeat-associated protein